MGRDHKPSLSLSLLPQYYARNYSFYTQSDFGIFVVEYMLSDYHNDTFAVGNVLSDYHITCVI